MPVPNESEVRREKLRALQDAGIRPYPAASHRTATCGEALERFDEWQSSGKKITVAGRVMTTRVHGALVFADIRDASGKIQILLKQDAVGEEAFALFRDRIDPADFIEATGTLFTTNRGEKTLQVSSWTVLAKALLPLPEKWHGLSDQEIRYRYRELDLIANPDVREVFRMRTQVIRSLRRALEDEGFEEVETPILQPIPGGATARPFVTHHNALDMDLYLRIAPELYLKRLVVGGLEKVFEINRNFRNEGISTRHNPEFTMLEFYEAYQDYNYLMDLTEELLRELAGKVQGTTTLDYQGTAIELGKPFDRLTMAQAIHKYNPEYPLAELDRREYLASALAAFKVEVFATDGVGLLQLKLFEETTEAKLIQPTFIVQYLTDVSPLARANDANPSITDRFELFITGRELANGFSELNDPEDQAARLQSQVDAR